MNISLSSSLKQNQLIRLFSELKIRAIYPPYIYSIQYDGKTESEFDRLFQLWNDVSYVIQFMEDNREFLNSAIWQKISIPEEAARQVLNEAIELEDLFEGLNKNTTTGRQPDFDTHFRYLEGKYKYELERPPMKSYGTVRPSLLRIYAIKMDRNTYLITGGGIKLADSIQNSPDLKDHILQNIARVRDFLKVNGIIDNDDMEMD